jgi:hypothetical protein
MKARSEGDSYIVSVTCAQNDAQNASPVKEELKFSFTEKQLRRVVNNDPNNIFGFINMVGALGDEIESCKSEVNQLLLRQNYGTLRKLAPSAVNYEIAINCLRSGRCYMKLRKMAYLTAYLAMIDDCPGRDALVAKIANLT